jgi:DNA replication protein DnaC
MAVLEVALSTELRSREASAVQTRIREARFPRTFTLDDFDFGVDKARVRALGDGKLVDKKRNVVFLGPVGTGKTHLATALGVEAARRRHRVAWFRAADLVRTLVEAKGSRSLGILERRIERSAVLDELGFVPFDREGGELLVNLLSARHGYASTVITSNLAFSEWPRVFGGDEKLTAVVLDRSAENAVVFTTKGPRYRQRRRR